MHLHWKYRELVKVIVKGKSFQQVKHVAISLEAESGGVLVSLDKTTKGYAIIVYRGKNYQSPLKIRPRNLLSRRQALARSIELQRREVTTNIVESKFLCVFPSKTKTSILFEFPFKRYILIFTRHCSIISQTYRRELTC